MKYKLEQLRKKKCNNCHTKMVMLRLIYKIIILVLLSLRVVELIALFDILRCFIEFQIEKWMAHFP